MKPIIWIFSVLALVYCVKAAPNYPYQFGDPYTMQANIYDQLKNLMNPENLKNQKGDVAMAAVSSSISNGVSQYHGVLANKQNGETNIQEFHGP